MNKIDILNEFKETINNENYESIICITTEDLKEIEDYEIVEYISYLDDSNDDLSSRMIRDIEPTYWLINFIVSKEYKTSDMNKIIKRIENEYPNTDIHIGSYIDNKKNYLCKVQILLCGDESNE